jgi:hypothetical protein
MNIEFELERIAEEVNWVRAMFVKMPGNPNPDKNIGCFTLRKSSDGSLVLLRHMGPAEAMEKYEIVSKEKGERLFNHPEHFSSWESRDPENKQWGGAIRTLTFIFSFSGLPELGDEAVMLVSAVRLKYLSYADAVRIAAISNNPFFQKLFDFCN